MKPPEDSNKLPTVAAFDFDKTLIRRDHFLPFLLYSSGAKRFGKALFSLLPHLFSGRAHLKMQMLNYSFPKISMEELKHLGEKFATEVLDRFLRKNALSTIEWHQKEGHKIALVSAGLEVTLIPWAKRHGIDTVLATQIEQKQGSFTLVGENCRCEEKVRRIEEHFGPKSGYTLYAYGDNRGDKEMLQLADYSFFRKI